MGLPGKATAADTKIYVFYGKKFTVLKVNKEIKLNYGIKLSVGNVGVTLSSLVKKFSNF